MKLVRSFLYGLAALIAAASLGLVAPTEAQAASCGSGAGKLIQSFNVYGVARLNVYYSTKNGGTNTACLMHQNGTWGRTMPTHLQVQRCTSYYSCSNVDNTVFDYGNYRYWAGPIGVSGTQRVCVKAFGRLINGHRIYEIDARNLGCGAKPQVITDQYLDPELCKRYPYIPQC